MKKPPREVFETHRPTEFALDVGAAACELLALFMADKPIHALLAARGLDVIGNEYPEYRKARIFKLLIEIATSYRIVSWRLSGHERDLEREKEVGLLVIANGADVPLSMHEACNKIIHADEFALETRKLRSLPLSYIKELSILASGKKGRDEWTICLFIPEFCAAAFSMPLPDGLPF